MVAARFPTVLGRRLQQRISLSSSPGRGVQQRRWAQVHDVRFLATTQAPRNIAEKYRERLDRKAQDEGLRDAAELKAAYADRIKELKRKDSITVPGLEALLADEQRPSDIPYSRSPPPPPPPPPPQLDATTGPQSQAQTQAKKQPTTQSNSGAAVKPLSEILDLPKARALPSEELAAVWRLRHSASAQSLCAVIPTATYRGIERTGRAHQTFVLPVPREGQGAEIHFLQWVFDAASGTSTVLFTQLAEFKARGEWAQPHTSITHYTDDGEKEGLSHEGNQGLVLMAGSVVDGRGASVEDARWLVMLLQRFYGEEGLGGDRAKRQLLVDFGRGDGNFSVEKLLEEAEKLG